MATFARPTLVEQLARVSGDIASRLEGHPFIRRQVERALGFAAAGVAHHLHGHLAWVRKQLFPQDAEREALIEWGDWLQEPVKTGSPAAGVVAVLGTGTLPIGTLFQSDDGVLYQSGAAVGAGLYTLTAVASGVAGNLAVGERVTLVSPVVGVEAVAEVSTAVSGGSDEEDTEDYRPRVLEALRSSSAFTGAPGDYRREALRQQGVTRAWEFDRRMGPGTVSVGFVLDERADIFPTADDVAALNARFAKVAPADMLAVYVAPPIRNGLRLSVTARGTMTETEVRDAVAAMLRTDAELEAPLAMSMLDEAISNVPGEISHTITALEIVERGIARSVSPAAAELVPGSWGLLALDALILQVVP